MLAAALLLLLFGVATADTMDKPMSAIRIDKEDYKGWPNTYRVSNGAIEVRVVTDVGPRIVDLRLAGGDNLLYVREAEAGKSGEKEWTFRGGWRLWVSPEKRETTYALDNAPCTTEVVGNDTLRVTGPAQPESGIQKIIEVRPDASKPVVHLRSRLRNVGSGVLTYAPWSLPVLRPGGRAFVPLDVGPLTSFDSIRRLILWSYARFSDPRYRFGDRLVQIDQAKVKLAPAGQQGRRDDESKIGTDSKQGWSAYLVGGTLFLKRWQYEEGERPDGGASIEVYSSHEFLELEHLGPLETIGAGEEIVLAEEWSAFAGVTVPEEESGALRVLEEYRKKAITPPSSQIAQKSPWSP